MFTLLNNLPYLHYDISDEFNEKYKILFRRYGTPDSTFVNNDILYIIWGLDTLKKTTWYYIILTYANNICSIHYGYNTKMIGNKKIDWAIMNINQIDLLTIDDYGNDIINVSVNNVNDVYPIIAYFIDYCNGDISLNKNLFDNYLNSIVARKDDIKLQNLNFFKRKIFMHQLYNDYSRNI